MEATRLACVCVCVCQSVWHRNESLLSGYQRSCNPTVQLHRCFHLFCLIWPILWTVWAVDWALLITPSWSHCTCQCTYDSYPAGPWNGNSQMEVSHHSFFMPLVKEAFYQLPECINKPFSSDFFLPVMKSIPGTQWTSSIGLCVLLFELLLQLAPLIWST